jgi:hypothetical protein
MNAHKALQVPVGEGELIGCDSFVDFGPIRGARGMSGSAMKRPAGNLFFLLFFILLSYSSLAGAGAETGCRYGIPERAHGRPEPGREHGRQESDQVTCSAQRPCR